MKLSPAYALAVWLRNAAMYRRTWMWNLLPNFFEPVFYLFSLGIGVGAYISQMDGVSYVAFIAPGLVCVAAMNGSHFLPLNVEANRLVIDRRVRMLRP